MRFRINLNNGKNAQVLQKKVKNDCGSLDGKHGCSGQSTVTNSVQEWVYVPEGTCEKITGGIVAKIKPAKTEKS
jgi:uncharacterized membrane protein